jgi:glucose-1-phosphate thymidylyltransferase
VSLRGLPDAFVIGEKFIGKDSVAMILGDNFFYGQNLSKLLLNNTKLNKGARVILHKVSKPELFGVAKINRHNKIIKIKEKPKKFFSDLAITGIYFFDNRVIEYAKKLKPSKRGEVEIVDLLNFYKSKNQLFADLIGRGGAWLDTGSMDDFYKTSTFVSSIENQQGLKIACLEEIAFNNKWINKQTYKNSIKFYGNCEYSKYLKKLI